MAQYECPSCGGGFPEPGPENECVWCGQELDGAYGPNGFSLPDPDIDGEKGTPSLGPDIRRVEGDESEPTNDDESNDYDPTAVSGEST